MILPETSAAGAACCAAGTVAAAAGAAAIIGMGTPGAGGGHFFPSITISRSSLLMRIFPRSFFLTISARASIHSMVSSMGLVSIVLFAIFSTPFRVSQRGAYRCSRCVHRSPANCSVRRLSSFPLRPQLHSRGRTQGREPYNQASCEPCCSLSTSQ